MFATDHGIPWRGSWGPTRPSEGSLSQRSELGGSKFSSWKLACIVRLGSKERKEPQQRSGAQGLCRKLLDRGMFCVFADNVGTVRCENGVARAEGNYQPCWIAPKSTRGALCKQRKIACPMYELERVLFPACV